MINDDVKIAENDKGVFYQSSFTKGAEEWAQKYGISDIQCYKVVQKDNTDDIDDLATVLTWGELNNPSEHSIFHQFHEYVVLLHEDQYLDIILKFL